MTAEDWSPSDLPAVSYIRVAPTTPMRRQREVEHQRAQIALAADRLGLRMADEFVDVGYSGMSMDRPDLRRLLDPGEPHVGAGRGHTHLGCRRAARSSRQGRDPARAAGFDHRCVWRCRDLRRADRLGLRSSTAFGLWLLIKGFQPDAYGESGNALIAR